MGRLIGNLFIIFCLLIGKPVAESTLTDEVTHDKIWKQSVKNEKTGVKQW